MPEDIVKDIAPGWDASEPRPAPVSAPVPDPEPTETQKVDGLIDAVEQINTAPRTQRIAGPLETPFQEFDREYKQRPMSLLGGLAFVRIIGKAIDNALSGDSAPKFADIVGVNSLSDLSGASSVDGFAKMLARLSIYSEDLFNDIYLLALNVPTGEREIVKAILQMPPEDDGRGGLAYSDGTEILKLFVAQNVGELVKLFREAGPAMVRQVQAAVSTPDSSTQ